MCVDVRSSDGSISPWLHGCRIINITKPAENDLKNVSKLEMVLPTGKPFKGNIDTDFFSTGDYLTLATDGYVGITKLITAKVVRSGSAYKLSTSETILDGAEIVPIGGPTSGTLKSSEVNILRNDDNAHILFDNEYYRLVKKSDTTLYYGCVSTDDTKSINKFFKILSSGKWTLLTLNVDLSNYYTKTESDGRYVKSVADTVNRYSVYAIGRNKDITIPLAEDPEAQAVVQYNSKGTVRTNTPTADLDAVNMSYGEGNYYQLDKGIYLPENADLNNYKTPATYKANPQVAGTVVNAPKGSSFFRLFVSTNPGTEVITQLLYSGSRVFTRSFAVLWDDWKEIATTDYVDNKTAVLIDNSLLGA